MSMIKFAGLLLIPDILHCESALCTALINQEKSINDLHVFIILLCSEAPLTAKLQKCHHTDAFAISPLTPTVL